VLPRQGARKEKSMRSAGAAIATNPRSRAGACAIAWRFRNRTTPRRSSRRAREITEGRCVELVLDAVGGESFRRSYRLLASAGRLGMFGVSTAANAEERDLLNMFKALASPSWR
jgi:NADPH:quinone reductase-like Zn-dependent oxidoreductase